MKKFSIFLITICLGLCVNGIVYADLDNGLMAYYPFQGNADDASGNLNHGIIHGDVRFVHGLIGQAASFDGRNSYISVPDNPTLDTGDAQDVTIQVWVKTIVRYESIIAKYDSNERGGVDLSIAIEGFPFFDGHDRTDFRIVTAPGAYVLDGQWHQIVGMRNGTVWSIWVDGIMENSVDAGTNSAMDNNDPLVIGNSENGNILSNTWFRGLIDEVRIYNRALTSTEIQELYGQGDSAAIYGCIELQGSAVDGAKVSLKQKGKPEESITDSIGCYQFQDIVPGNLTIKIEIPGSF